MLVLTRQKGQAIEIGSVIVKVIEIKGARVRLGIEADPSIKVSRAEFIKPDLEERQKITVPMESP